MRRPAARAAWWWYTAKQASARRRSLEPSRTMPGSGASRWPGVGRRRIGGAPPFWPWRQALAALDGPDLPGGSTGADPASERFARFEAVQHWLAARSRSSAIALVFDDAHAADEPSLRLLAHVVASLEEMSALVVITHRDTPADLT